MDKQQAEAYRVAVGFTLAWLDGDAERADEVANDYLVTGSEEKSYERMERLTKAALGLLVAACQQGIKFDRAALQATAYKMNLGDFD